MTPAKLKLSVVLMILTIALVTGFQVYWIQGLYKQQKDVLKRGTDIAFRDVVYKLQLQHFQKDSGFFHAFLRSDTSVSLFVYNALDSLRDKLADSLAAQLPEGKPRQVMITVRAGRVPDSLGTMLGTDTPGIRKVLFLQKDTPLPGPHVRRWQPAFTTGELDSSYKVELTRNNTNIPFVIHRVVGGKTAPGPFQTSVEYIGMPGSDAYQASFGNPFWYIMGRLKVPLLVGFFLLGFTLLSFLFMYRTLREQRQLAIHKNEFISNMTHELKTPLATVNVAVEALRNFNALDNPERTREYLDISALELQRLSLLVDKVLKLSQLEKKEVELHPEPLDLFALAVEVIDGLRLQLDKAGVQTLLTHGGGDFTVKADRVHMSGVLMNLLDNAVKYGGPAPRIEVHLARRGSAVILSVTDNGRGIPPEYAGKVFEQFFRVPSGDRHDTKGYGLGLSYVRDILHRHGGSVRVDSQVGRGSTFTLQLPAA